MEKQILGEIDGDFTCRDCEPHDPQVTVMQMVCVAVKPNSVSDASSLSSILL